MPGLFSRYGAMGNPLFDLLAAGQIGSNVAQSNLAAAKMASQPDPTSMAFANRAYQTGEMAPQVPRQPGLFSNLGVKLGILSPEVAARSKDVMFMQEALAGERKEQLEDLKTITGLRTALGPTGFGQMEGTPSMRGISMFATGKGAAGTGGTPELDLTGLTPREQQTAGLERYRQSEEKIAQERIDLATRQLDLANRRETRLASVPKLGTPEYEAAIGRATVARTQAAEETKDNLYNNSWLQWDRINKGQLAYYDKKKLSLVDRSVVRTPGAASNDPAHYKLVNQKGQDIINKIRDQTHRADEIINDVAVIFPDTRHSTGVRKGWEIEKSALRNHFTSERYNKDVVDFNQMQADVLQYIRELQQRYPTAIELKTIGKGSFPDMYRDGRAEAINKMKKIKEDLRIAADVTTDQENTAEQQDAMKALYNTNTYGYEEPITPTSEAEPPPPTVPEGMGPPPAEFTSPGETPSDVMPEGGTP